MPIIKEDFIGKYFFKRAFVFRPAENESSCRVGSKVDGKVKTFLGNPVSTIIEDETWMASSPSSRYQGIEKAFNQGLINEAEWRELLCHQIYRIITLPGYRQFGDAKIALDAKSRLPLHLRKQKVFDWKSHLRHLYKTYARE